jgi:hypothetical protein
VVLEQDQSGGRVARDLPDDVPLDLLVEYLEPVRRIG